MANIIAKSYFIRSLISFEETSTSRIVNVYCYMAEGFLASSTAKKGRTGSS